MPIPTFHAFFRPFLDILADGSVLHMRDVQARLQAASGCTPAELMQKLPSGGSTVIENRIGWARTDLYKAGLVERVSRATYRITVAGREVLKAYPGAISRNDLLKIPAFKSWIDEIRARQNAPTSATADSSAPESLSTAQEGMIRGERELRQLVEGEILTRLDSMSWARFEWLVEQLVVKLGYGASDQEVRGSLSTGSGDSGVDGVIKEDRLGLGQIYLQAKRWQATVGRPAIQAFVGAMHGRAQKGVFLTNSDFSRDARDYAESLGGGLRVRLIDGRELASLMVDCGLGVTEERSYRTFRLDSDFFDADDGV